MRARSRYRGPMSTYVVGDVQGCFDSLMALLDRVDFDPARDRLWIAGDLVNRGPKSLEVLRWARDHAPCLTAVLGNHDVHLLARAAGVKARKKRDTLDDVLDAPDRDELISWLRARPLIHRQDRWLMVHAGLHPSWTAAEAAALAAEVEQALQGDAWAEILARAGDEPPAWSPDLDGIERLHAILGVLIRVRTVRADGRLCDDYSGPPEGAPAGCTPWYAVPDRRSKGTPILFGHWSTLGLLVERDHIALDTACVWGGRLTAYRLEDGEVFEVVHAEPSNQPGKPAT
jgi:bis(5'-nucleosyl)-tetraphosphatase (symmetrical)